MPKSLFAKNQPCCAYCLHGRLSDCGDKILCPHKGIVPTDYSCRRFDYDPLLRVPRRPAPLPAFNREDFKL